MHIRSPVSEVSPMQPAAIMTPNTAAASSSSTTLVLGSRLCITAHMERQQNNILPKYSLQCSDSLLGSFTVFILISDTLPHYSLPSYKLPPEGGAESTWKSYVS